jgi:protein polybromo-1
MHEQMYTVWEAVRYLADGYGRPRARLLLKNISRKDYPDFFETINRPMCLDKVQKNIETAKYNSIDVFEEDMTLIFENTREFFDPSCEVYADAEIMQNIFWEALGAVEQGQVYAVQETPGDFVRQRKRKPTLQALPPLSGSVPGGDTEISAQSELVSPSNADAGNLQASMLKAWQAVRKQRDKHHKERALAFVELPSKKDYPDYYRVIKKPVDLSIVYAKLRQGAYNEWRAFELDMQQVRLEAHRNTLCCKRLPVDLPSII